MTEGQRLFFKRRIREELKKANAPENRLIRNLHLRWALLYQERLDGMPRILTRSLEAKLREGRYEIELIEALDEKRNVAMPPKVGASLQPRMPIAI